MAMQYFTVGLVFRQSHFRKRNSLPARVSFTHSSKAVIDWVNVTSILWIICKALHPHHLDLATPYQLHMRPLMFLPLYLVTMIELPALPTQQIHARNSAGRSPRHLPALANLFPPHLICLMQCVSIPSVWVGVVIEHYCVQVVSREAIKRECWTTITASSIRLFLDPGVGKSCWGICSIFKTCWHYQAFSYWFKAWAKSEVRAVWCQEIFSYPRSACGLL